MSRIITFYSYKGGTGRSMALANVAWILASAGNRVLAIDWDLEAPGLHRYFHPFLTDKELIGQESQGVIDMAMDFAVRAATPLRQGEKRGDKWVEEYADFSKWRQKLRWPSGEALRLGKEGKGEIDFVPAGRQGADYAKRVNRFDWHNFYQARGGGAFFDAAKHKLDAYDYVLIDSRTGVSDTSGICTIQMPDTLVVCFTLNYQSIKGALAVAQSVREQRPEIRIFPLPTRVDGSEEKLLNRMKNYAKGAFGPLLDLKVNASEYWFSMEVPYFARYAYAEKLALFEEQASISASTLPAMVRLSQYLTDGVVKSVGPLPRKEQILTLAEFEGIEGADRERLTSAIKRERASPASSPSATEANFVKVFVSYAPEDWKTAQAIAEGLRKLNEMGYRIKVFLDVDSIRLADNFSNAVKTALEESDFLVIVDTVEFARSHRHSYTGVEVGFFSGLMDQDVKRQRESKRSIFYLCVEWQPNLGGDSIDIGIGRQDLKGSRADYMQKPIEPNDPLARFFYTIADHAAKAFPLAFNTHQLAREYLINDIIPTVRGSLFDSMSARASLSIEQKRIEFELSSAAAGQTFDSIPQDTRVTLYSGAGDLFRVAFKEETVTWEELSRAARDSSMLRGLELLVTNAVSPFSDFENSQQTIRSPGNGRVFDALVSRRTDYFDGRKIVEVYFIERREYGKRDTSIILGFITQAARYKSIFELESPISVESFIVEPNPARVQDKVREFIRQLRSIEAESVDLGLGDASNIVIYMGDDRSRLAALGSHLETTNETRVQLFASAERILHTPVDSTEFRTARVGWLASLTSFVQANDKLLSTIIVPAIDNLKKAFVGTSP
jgi:cellulose biosynthesis protein BcsQ